MTQDGTCPNCGKKITKYDLFCDACRTDLPQENWDKRVAVERRQTTQVTKIETDEVEYIATKKEEDKKWYKPPEDRKKRPAYHPLEWLFWIGWSFYVFFLFLGRVFLWFLKEVKNYFIWCCYWGPPKDLKKE